MPLSICEGRLRELAAVCSLEELSMSFIAADEVEASITGRWEFVGVSDRSLRASALRRDVPLAEELSITSAAAAAAGRLRDELATAACAEDELALRTTCCLPEEAEEEGRLRLLSLPLWVLLVDCLLLGDRAAALAEPTGAAIPGPPPKLDWLLENRAKSSFVAGRETAGIKPPSFSLAFRGLQLRHRPFNTRPWSVMGIILNNFFWKHLRPHIIHSPLFRRSSSSSDLLITDPVALKSIPSCSMMTGLLVAV